MNFNPINKEKYRVLFKSFTIPAVYDDTLTVYENIAKLRYDLQSLVDQLNAKWNKENADKFSEYLGDLFVANFNYTPEDKGLHIYFDDLISSGDHQYDPETETMKITTKEDDSDEPFKL